VPSSHMANGTLIKKSLPLTPSVICGELSVTKLSLAIQLDRPARRRLQCRQSAGPRSATEPFQWQRRVPGTLCHRASGLSRLWTRSGTTSKQFCSGHRLMTGQDCHH